MSDHLPSRRFAEHVTSGAFSLTLSRRHISTLGLLATGSGLEGQTMDGLERRGLVEALPSAASPGRLHWRPTLAGLRCMDLLAEAGLVNHPTGAAVATEFAAMRAEITDLIGKLHDLRDRAASAMARKDAAERRAQESKREVQPPAVARGLQKFREWNP